MFTACKFSLQLQIYNLSLSPLNLAHRAGRYHPFRLLTILKYRDCRTYKFIAAGGTNPFKLATLICHVLSSRSSTLARQPVASRTTAHTLPQDGSPTQEGLSCDSKTG